MAATSHRGCAGGRWSWRANRRTRSIRATTTPRHVESQAQREGLDLALISPSSPLGIELLPPRESRELLDAYHDGALELPDAVRRMGGRVPDRSRSRRACAASSTVASSGSRCRRARSAPSMATSALAPLLEVLEDAGRPLFIHPGPATAPRSGSELVADDRLLRRADVRGVVRVPGVRAAAAPDASGVLCDAGRAGAAARRAVAGARRAAHGRRRELVPRGLLLRDASDRRDRPRARHRRARGRL